MKQLSRRARYLRSKIVLMFGWLIAMIVLDCSLWYFHEVYPSSEVISFFAEVFTILTVVPFIVMLSLFVMRWEYQIRGKL